MGQYIGTRIEVLGTLTCLGPVHVGGWDTTAEANLTVARDGLGQPYLPGTSIAGALRAYLAGVDLPRGGDPAAVTNALFGNITPNSRDGSPSWIRIDDAHLVTERAPIGAGYVADEVAPTVRDGVGIDRVTATAAANFLYTRQVLPAGTRFAFRLVADTPTTAAPDYPGGWSALVRDAVGALVAGLAQARVPIGAGRGRGFGRMELGEVTTRSADLSDPAGLVAWLTGTAPTLSPPLAEESWSHGDQPRSGRDQPRDGRLRISIAWRPAGPLLVRDSLSGTVVDTLPLTDTAADGTVRLLLPGSSIRGALRAHAERIVRTLQRQDAPKDFLDALRQPPPGVDVLFGSAPTGDRDPSGRERPAGQDSDRRGRRGTLAVADCHSVEQVDAQQWNDIISISPDPTNPASQGERAERQERNDQREQARSGLQKELAKVQQRLPLAVSDHVAIDRWTGGASDHRLFSVLEPDQTTRWEPMQIDVDVAQLDRYGPADVPGSVALALPLLLLVLRDLRDGWLTLGFGGSRGRGQIEVTGMTFDGAGLSTPWQALAGHTLDTVLTDPPPQVTAAMTGWASAFQEAGA